MYLSDNIKFLRKRKKLTQTDLANSLDTKRENINNYEHGLATPPLDMIIKLSDLFHVSIDTLLRINLSTLRESQLYQIEKGNDIFIKGNEIRVLATTLDSRNNDNIELVSIKAKAGYTNGFSDPEYISQLPTFSLPFLSKDRKYRTFQISGDSMLPIQDKSWITGEYIQDFNTIKNNELYIVITYNQGIIFKRVVNEIKNKRSLKMISLNKEYSPYDLHISEVQEVWKFVHYISNEIQEFTDTEQIYNQMEMIKNEIIDIKKKLN